MDKTRLISILEDWNFWKRSQETGIERPVYLEKLKRYAKAGEAIIITGARRSGKSVIMRQFAKHLIDSGTNPNDILIINFEDPRLPELDSKALQGIYETYLEYLNPKGKPFILLDEIQEVRGWEKWVRMMHELGKADIIISGSNAKLLGEELATVLTGRHLDMTVFPLSFREFLSFKNINISDRLDMIAKRIEIKRMLGEFLENGSYPKVVLGIEKKETLESYYEDILNKDLIRRYKIRKTAKLRALSGDYFSNAGCPTTFTSIEKYLGISKDTVNKYSRYFENVYLLFFLTRFSFKVKEQEKSPRKVYAIDPGMANAVGFRFSENKGRMAENAVFLELERRHKEKYGSGLYYWKDIHGKEVDFVVMQNQKVEQLIQVSWISERPELKKRETEALIAASIELKCNNLLVITDEYSGEEDIDGKKIQFIPLWMWLIEQ